MYKYNTIMNKKNYQRIYLVVDAVAGTSPYKESRSKKKYIIMRPKSQRYQRVILRDFIQR